jgi:RES domain-containing protein
MTEVYRLVKAERADDALSGEGAARYGGRWNPPGCPVVYASASRALAVLEVFVHLTLEARAMRFLLYEITLPRRARVKRHGEEFASHHPRPPASRQEAGRAWLDDGTALALVVPSVIVPQEANYVLNIRHTQFAQLRVAGPEPFSFDERLWQSRSAGE